MQFAASSICFLYYVLTIGFLAVVSSVPGALALFQVPWAALETYLDGAPWDSG